MIGQHGSFDMAKYRRDFRDSFYGIEACLFESDEDMQRLTEMSQQDGFAIGVHFPLRSGQSEMRDALLLSLDDDERNEAFGLVARELDYLTKVKPAYILFHHPKPVILDNRVDWNGWRFADDREFVYEKEYGYDAFAARSEEMFGWLQDKGKQFGFTPVLEFDALNRYVYDTDLLEGLLDKYPGIRLCLDTGRLHLQDRRDPYFDAVHVLKKFARYAELIHLWTSRVTDRIEYNHYPVLPGQQPEDGWAPVADYLRIIRAENPGVKVMFEIRSDAVSDEDLERCYAWVDELINIDRWSGSHH